MMLNVTRTEGFGRGRRAWKASKTGVAVPFESRRSLVKIKDQVSTSNGLDWDRERNLMYYIDTPTQEIVRYSYDPQSGDVSNPEPVYRFDQSDGLPDGMTIDQNGMLWVALFGGSRVVHIDPFQKKKSIQSACRLNMSRAARSAAET